MTLHLFYRGLSHQSLFERMSVACCPGDCLVLLGDGLAWVTQPATLEARLSDVAVCAIKDEAQTLGLDLSLKQDLNTLSWAELARRSAQAERSVTWF